MLPITQEFDATFVKSCSEYSKIVQLRKYESFQTTIKAQLYEILASTGHVTCKAINEKHSSLSRMIIALKGPGL